MSNTAYTWIAAYLYNQHTAMHTVKAAFQHALALVHASASVSPSIHDCLHLLIACVAGDIVTIVTIVIHMVGQM